MKQLTYKNITTSSILERSTWVCVYVSNTTSTCGQEPKGTSFNFNCSPICWNHILRDFTFIKLQAGISSDYQNKTSVATLLTSHKVIVSACLWQRSKRLLIQELFLCQLDFLGVVGSVILTVLQFIY